MTDVDALETRLKREQEKTKIDTQKTLNLLERKADRLESEIKTLQLMLKDISTDLLQKQDFLDKEINRRLDARLGTFASRLRALENAEKDYDKFVDVKMNAKIQEAEVVLKNTKEALERDIGIKVEDSKDYTRHQIEVLKGMLVDNLSQHERKLKTIETEMRRTKRDVHAEMTSASAGLQKFKEQVEKDMDAEYSAKLRMMKEQEAGAEKRILAGVKAQIQPKQVETLSEKVEELAKMIAIIDKKFEDKNDALVRTLHEQLSLLEEFRKRAVSA